MNVTTDSHIRNRNMYEQPMSNGKLTKRWRIWKACRGDRTA